MKIEEIKEEAIACGWVDLFENEGKLWGYASDRDVMPQMYPKQPRKWFESPVWQGQGNIGVISRFEGTIERAKRDRTLRRFELEARNSWMREIPQELIAPSGFRQEPIAPWLEVPLPRRGGEDWRSLRVNNLRPSPYFSSVRGKIVGYCISFQIDSVIGAECYQGLETGKKVYFSSGDRAPEEFTIVRSTINITMDNLLQVILKIVC